VNNQFDNVHKNKRGFLIGGGPSILDIIDQGFSFKLLESEITIGINKAYKLLTPNYLVFSDPYFWNNFKEEIQKVSCLKICPDSLAKKFKIEDSDIFVVKGNLEESEVTYVKSLSEIVPIWNCSGLFGLRIMYAMGLNPIYLIGIDLVKENGRGRTHFHTDYDPKRVSQTKPKRIDEFFKCFVKTIKGLEKEGAKIYSCSKSSILNKIIEYVNLKGVVK